MAAKKKSGPRKAPRKQPPARKVTPAKKPARTKSEAPTVERFMTKSVHTIGIDQPLSLAHKLMNEHRIRHLPVLEGGKLCGLVSQRDLYFIESLDETAPDRVGVDEAMTQEVFEAAPNAALADVVRTLIDKKHGCAVITQRGQVVGVFSAIDGLQALLEYLPS